MSEAGRTLPVPGLLNGRDLGGLARHDGTTTPSGVFLRSEVPDLVDPAGWRVLVERGVRSVLDLREPGERAARRSRPPGEVADLHVAHDGLEHEAFWADYWDAGLGATPVYYLPHVQQLPERTVAVLSAIATAPTGGLLLHCAGGRDRTGIVAAVLLRIAGATDDAIVQDYLASIANAPALAAARGRPDEEPAVAALLASRGTTSETAFRAFLAGLDVDALLAALPAEQADALRTWRGALPAA